MAIYLISCNEFVKIGIAANVSKRLSQLQGSNPYRLEVLDFFKAPRLQVSDSAIEKAIHADLNRWRVRGEWFLKNDDVIRVWENYKAMYGETELPPNILRKLWCPYCVVDFGGQYTLLNRYYKPLGYATCDGWFDYRDYCFTSDSFRFDLVTQDRLVKEFTNQEHHVSFDGDRSRGIPAGLRQGWIYDGSTTLELPESDHAESWGEYRRRVRFIPSELSAAKSISDCVQKELAFAGDRSRLNMRVRATSEE